MLLSTAMVVYAAEASFTTTLPRNQGDIEVSTVRRAFSYTVWSVTINSISDISVTDRVCAWTESSLGRNYSNTYIQVGVGEHSMNYDLVIPDVGDNVVLNMDNPIMTSQVVGVSGYWSPDE